MDIAIVFGPQVPLLAPLALGAVVGHRWTVRVAMRRLGKREVGWDKSRPAVWAIAISLLEQQALGIWLFREMDLNFYFDGGAFTGGGSVADTMRAVAWVAGAVVVAGVLVLWVKLHCCAKRGKRESLWDLGEGTREGAGGSDNMMELPGRSKQMHIEREGGGDSGDLTEGLLSTNESS